jgi:hypothetical protein
VYIYVIGFKCPPPPKKKLNKNRGGRGERSSGDWRAPSWRSWFAALSSRSASEASTTSRRQDALLDKVGRKKSFATPSRKMSRSRTQASLRPMLCWQVDIAGKKVKESFQEKEKENFRRPLTAVGHSWISNWISGWHGRVLLQKKISLARFTFRIQDSGFRDDYSRQSSGPESRCDASFQVQLSHRVFLIERLFFSFVCKKMNLKMKRIRTSAVRFFALFVQSEWFNFNKHSLIILVRYMCHVLLKIEFAMCTYIHTYIHTYVCR